MKKFLVLFALICSVAVASENEYSRANQVRWCKVIYEYYAKEREYCKSLKPAEFLKYQERISLILGLVNH